MIPLPLTGLDGKNPLGFLAALGTLAALTDAHKGGEPPRLRWQLAGTYLPVLENVPEREVLLDVLMADLTSFRHEPAIQGRIFCSSGAKKAV